MITERWQEEAFYEDLEREAQRRMEAGEEDSGEE